MIDDERYIKTSFLASFRIFPPPTNTRFSFLPSTSSSAHSKMLSFKMLSISSLFFYSTVYAATIPSGKMATCGVQVTPVCADIHRGCQDALSLSMTSKVPDLQLMHIPLPGNVAMYQSKDNQVGLQVDDPADFVGRATIKLKSSSETGFNAALILVNKKDGKAHGLTYKLPAKVAGDPTVRYCHHQLPKGFKASDVQMAQAVQDA